MKKIIGIGMAIWLGSMLAACSDRSGVDFAAREHFELNNTYQDILTVTVSAPAKGFVTLTGSGYIKLIRRGGDAWVNLSIGPASGRSNNDHQTSLKLPASVGSMAEFDYPFSLSAVLPVEPGDQTFYLVGIKDPNPGQAYADYTKLTAVFVERRL
jgi:hypothetical protein